MNSKNCLSLIVVSAAAGAVCMAHDVPFKHLHGDTNPAAPLNFVVEQRGPIKTPSESKEQAVSGQGFWKFAAAKSLVPVPEETKPFLKGAHGTIVVDAERDVVYWGLEKVGWVAFSNKLSQSWVVKGDPKFSTGNLHGADILPRPGKLPLVVAADNVEGEVYLSDTSFQHAEKLTRPGGPYEPQAAKFMPTDAAFIDAKDIYVTDGYGSQWFMHATVDPLKFDGTFIGGREFSKTPHGITYKRDSKTLLVSARPEAQLKEYVFEKDKWLPTMGLPAGSTVCDMDVWEEYALAPCLDGPNKSTGPIYIVNLKTKAIVSTIRVKDDLGYTDALHIHDAAWYISGKGPDRELYILFTNWNPGGMGAIKLVNVPDVTK